jgi:tRNA 5-methylaminomethyl-2-thiouridine biosynthesis bifunctional protein
MLKEAAAMPDLDWIGNTPRSTRFDDVYFQAEDGLSESRAVFLDGCGLPGRFAGRRRFAVGELGFGAGLNILALLDLWRRRRRGAEARLSIVSIEAFPMTADEAARALAAFPELAELAADLLTGWPSGRSGRHIIDFPDIGATLQIHVGDVRDALGQLDAKMDAWFLDGFAPAKNPDMWSDEVLSQVGRLTAPGGRAATFTVAGDVRRGLAAAGFSVDKRPGFGRKRERLEAIFPGAPSDRPVSPVAVIGAGVAGASLARALTRQGLTAVVFEADRPGAGASGNPAALVTPRLDAGFGDVARLHALAFARAVQVYRSEAPAALIARGALQLEVKPKDADRFDRLAASDIYGLGGFERLDREKASARLGEPLTNGALRYRDALVIEPMVALQAFLQDADVRRASVDRLVPAGGSWTPLAPDGTALGVFEHVVLAGGPLARRLWRTDALRTVRGQVTLSRKRMTGEAVAWGGYLIPTRNGVLFGATHQRGDDDARARGEDDVQNLAALAEARPSFAATLPAALTHRASVRVSTPDHWPMCGQISEGLWALTGLGGRGFTLAPLLAESLAASLAGAPDPLELRLKQRMAPRRFDAGSPLQTEATS